MLVESTVIPHLRRVDPEAYTGFLSPCDARPRLRPKAPGVSVTRLELTDGVENLPAGRIGGQEPEEPRMGPVGGDPPSWGARARQGRRAGVVAVPGRAGRVRGCPCW